MRIVLRSRRDLMSPRSKNRRHRRPHLPRCDLPRLRPQRNHRPRLLQSDHPLRNHGKARDLHGERIRHSELSLQDVAHSISRNFGVVFESQMLWLESLDALLGHPVGVPLKPPEATAPPAQRRRYIPGITLVWRRDTSQLSALAWMPPSRTWPRSKTNDSPSNP